MFHPGDLQSGIALAVQQRKTVLCFVHDHSDKSVEWEHALTEGPQSETIQHHAVSLRITAGSQEASFLAPICPINSIPAIIIIKDAALQANILSAEVETDSLNDRLATTFGTASTSVSSTHDPPAESSIRSRGPAEVATGETGTWPPPASTVAADSSSASPGYLTLPVSSGQFRLPNNAYDALREHTDSLIASSTASADVFTSQVQLLSRLPILGQEVARLRSLSSRDAITLSDHARDKLLRMPAAAIKAQPKSNLSSATAQSSPSESSSSPASGGQQTVTTSRPNRGGDYVYYQPDTTELQAENEHEEQKRAELEKKRQEAALWTRMQKERQAKDREARERVKASIAADREERRRLNSIQTQNERIADMEAEEAAKRSRPSTGDVRVQVRTFDGSTLRDTFRHDSTLGKDVRSWIDERTGATMPYNLKLILTPLPNRNIEASEEEQSLSDLGIRGSCTLVMVAVKGYVESYTGQTSGGLVSNAFSGGYSLVTGTAGALFGGVKYVLGYGGSEQEQTASNEEVNTSSVAGQGPKLKVRTLADQRMEQMNRRGPNSQLYNGNQLNFEPNKDDEDEKRKD